MRHGCVLWQGFTTSLRSYVSWLSSVAMLRGYPPWLCFMAILHVYASWLSSVAMLRGYLPWLCFMAVLHDNVSYDWAFTSMLHDWTPWISSMTILHDYNYASCLCLKTTLQRLCFMVDFLYLFHEWGSWLCASWLNASVLCTGKW